MTDRDHPTGVWDLSSLTGATAPPTPPPSLPSPSPSPSPSLPLPSSSLLPPPGASSAAELLAAAVEDGGARPVAGRGRLLIVAGAIVALLFAGGGVGMALHARNAPQQSTGGQAVDDQPGIPAVVDTTTDPAAPDPVEPDPVTPDPTTPDPTTPDRTTPDPTTPDPEADALASLEQTYEQDRDSVAFNGRYAAQIASKYPGIVDKLQTAADGTHTFQATDILAEYQQLSTAHDSSEHPVVLLKSTDYGKRQRLDGHFLWVTFAVGDFPDAQSVHRWCNAQFASLSTTERENQCAVRRLEPGR
jgi:hypothetical protein